MAISSLIDSIQDIDLDQFNDLDRIGSWPSAVKVLIQTLCFVSVLALGYFLHITGLQQELAEVQARESRLKSDYEQKFFNAAHLEAYRQQQQEMEASFEAILGQLPSDTEIPGLIEDITLAGLRNGLTFDSIDLQTESRHEFYIEKPIAMAVSGGYHNLGSFVKDIADLPRIVTLHDFSIKPNVSGSGSGTHGSNLTMDVLAKTYRYNAR